MLNRNKDENRKNKIIFIYGSRDYKEEKVRNKLRDTDIEKIVSMFKGFRNIDKYSHIADFSELSQSDFNLNVPRYVDTSENEEEVDIQATINKIKKLKMESYEIELQVETTLNELGFNI